MDRLRRRLGRAIGKDWQLQVDTSLDSPLVVNPDDEVVTVNPDHETIPSTGTVSNEFLSRLLGSAPGSSSGYPDRRG